MRSRDLRRLFSLVVVLLVLALGSFVAPDDLPAPAEQNPAPSKDEEVYSVVRVVDGDTIVVSIDGNEEKVRLIGVNAPESVDPRRGMQCFGKEASEHLRTLLEGQVVTLTIDPTQDEIDKYDRWLRYVELPTMDVGRQMILDGYAYEYTYDVPYERQEEYQNAMDDAEAQGAGLWSEETCNGEV